MESPQVVYPKKSSFRSIGFLKTGWTGKIVGLFMYKKECSTLTRKNLEEFNRSMEETGYHISPYNNGLLLTDEIPGTSTEAHGTNTIAENFSYPSPYYGGLLESGKEVSVLNTSVEDESNHIDPYYKGLLFAKKLGGASPEVESTSYMVHDFQNLSLWSPNYKGLLYSQMEAPCEKEITVSDTSVEDTTYRISPDYKVHGQSPEVESTSPSTNDLENLCFWSPDYKWLLYSEMEVPDEKVVTGTAFNSSVEDNKHHISPDYKGLLVMKRVHDTSPEVESTSPTAAHDSENLGYWSPNYKGLFFTEKVLGTNSKAESTNPLTPDFQNSSVLSAYYKGLLFTEKILRTSSEPESTNISTPHDIPNSCSPYYIGLLNQTTSPDRESVTSSSSRMSFPVKMLELGAGCFTFRSKDEKPPTMLKLFPTENSNQESLRERGSEPASPQLSPPQATSPSPPALSPSASKRVVVNEEAVKPEDEKKYIWVDKYRPVTLNKFICNKDRATELQEMIKDEECCHFIFEGQAGVGKRTMIRALLSDIYGHDKVQARDQCKTFNLKGEGVSSIIVNVKESCQHVEVNITELKGFEKHVIVELIKEANMLTNKSTRCSKDNCRAIILREADKLSTDALLYIRWVIERYKGCHKVFFCCQDASKLQHLMNICKLIRFLPPSNGEIVEVLELIAKEEKIELPRQLAEKIAINSKHNLRQAIRSFEASWHHNPHLEGDQIILTGWEDDIGDIAKSIVEKQSPKQLYDIYRKFQNLIDHSVPPEFIFETLKNELKKIVDESMHNPIEKTYKEYTGKGAGRFSNDEREKLIQEFMNIEEFIAIFMSFYKNYLVKQAVKDMTESEDQRGTTNV